MPPIISSSGFFSPPLSVTAVAGEQGRPQKSPSSAPDPGDGRNHIISAVRQSHCQERASHESNAEYPEIPQMPRLSLRPKKTGCRSNERSKFHNDLRQRGAAPALVVLTKLPRVDMGRRRGAGRPAGQLCDLVNLVLTSGSSSRVDIKGASFLTSAQSPSSFSNKRKRLPSRRPG